MKKVLVLDFGGQYNQLIARRVRECNVYCEIYSYRTDLAKIKAKNPKGIIFTGGPNSVYLKDSHTIDPEIFSWGVPVLGILGPLEAPGLMLHGSVSLWVRDIPAAWACIASMACCVWRDAPQPDACASCRSEKICNMAPAASGVDV